MTDSIIRCHILSDLVNNRMKKGIYHPDFIIRRGLIAATHQNAGRFILKIARHTTTTIQPRNIQLVKNQNFLNMFLTLLLISSLVNLE